MKLDFLSLITRFLKHENKIFFWLNVIFLCNLASRCHLVPVSPRVYFCLPIHPLFQREIQPILPAEFMDSVDKCRGALFYRLHYFFSPFISDAATRPSVERSATAANGKINKIVYVEATISPRNLNLPRYQIQNQISVLNWKHHFSFITKNEFLKYVSKMLFFCEEISLFCFFTFLDFSFVRKRLNLFVAFFMQRSLKIYITDGKTLDHLNHTKSTRPLTFLFVFSSADLNSAVKFMDSVE